MKGQTGFTKTNLTITTYSSNIYILQISVKHKSFEMQKFASIVKYNEQLSDKKTKQGPSGKLKVPQMWYI